MMDQRGTIKYFPEVSKTAPELFYANKVDGDFALNWIFVFKLFSQFKKGRGGGTSETRGDFRLAGFYPKVLSD